MSLAATATGLICHRLLYREAAETFSEAGTVEAYLTFEAALARVEGRLGVIPPEAAREISAACRREAIDFAELREGSSAVGYPIVKLVSLLAQQAGPSGQWVHYGTTTQDVMDTAMILQVRQAVAPVLSAGRRLEADLIPLCETHRWTPMAGRSKHQHGVPIPFGYKVAVWLDAAARARQNLERAMKEASIVQFGGAVGTLASMGPAGMEVRRELAMELDLAEPDISWHVSRDRITALGTAIVSYLSVLAKIAVDISYLSASEISELREPRAPGRGSSSTMPQKRNPALCEAIIEAARDMEGVPAQLLSAQRQEQERGLGHGYRERRHLCEAVCHLAGALDVACELIQGLEVDTASMDRNMASTRGLIYSEAAMMHLSATVGRVAAHDSIHEVSTRMETENVELREALKEHFPEGIPDRVFSPDPQMASAQQMIDRVLKTART